MKIKSVKKIHNQPVYNMQVADVHCFAVGKRHVIVHNCDALRYACQSNLRPAVFSFERGGRNGKRNKRMGQNEADKRSEAVFKNLCRSTQYEYVGRFDLSCKTSKNVQGRSKME